MKEINSNKLNSLGFKNVETALVGKFEGYFLSVRDKQDVEDQLEISISIADNPNKGTLFAALDALRDKNEIAKYSFNEEKILIDYIESVDSNIEDFLADVTKALKEIDAVNVCDCCDETENLSYYANSNGVYSLFCEKCGAKLIKDFEEDNNKRSNYIVAFVASLIGALIGSLLWILIGLAGFVASIAGYAIAFCAFKGYVLAKGKWSRLGIILNIVAILVAFLFAEFVGLYISLHKADIGVENLQYYILWLKLYITDPEVITIILKDLGLGLLFIVLGSYRTIINNYKNAKSREEFTITKIDL